MKKYILTILPIIAFFISVHGQDVFPVQPYPNAGFNSLPGKIVFMSDSTALGDLSPDKVINNYQFNLSGNLYLKIVLANSLTNILHKANPALSNEQLHQGTLAFEFDIDGKKSYTEEIKASALSDSVKDTRKVIMLPFYSDKEYRTWGQSLWYRFLMKAGNDALTTGDHLLTVKVMPDIATPKFQGPVMAEGSFHILVKPASVAQTEIQPIAGESGWPISEDSYDKDKIRELNSLIAQNKFRHISSVVVIKDGKLLIEEYFNGQGRDSLINPRSVSKSFTSSMMGIALKEGYINSINETLDKYYALNNYKNYSSYKKDITIKSLLTMSSLFNADDGDSASPGNEDNMYPTLNWVSFALDLPIDSSKLQEKKWHYFTAGIVLLGDILNKSVPGGLEKYADEKLFKPLGITHYVWAFTPQHVPNTAGGLEMTPLDYAKYGQLYANNGEWHGTQIIPKEWIGQTFHHYMTLPAQNGGGFYGYLFWNKTFIVNGKSLETYFCTGNGGNKVYIFPEQNIVVVIAATAYNTPYAHPQADKMMQQYILPAIQQR